MLKSALSFAVVLTLLAALPSDADVTAFTYQGKLTDSAGVALTGSYDMTFKLFDAETAGAQVGSTVTLTGVAVSSGLFTAKLDFGAAPFASGAARWLETGVDTITLSPRVEITPSPGALFSAAPWATSAAGISYVGNVGIGTVSPDRPLTIQGSEWLSLKDNTGATKWHLYNRSGGLEFVETGVAPRLTLAAGGKVGIGNGTPGFPLNFAPVLGDKISLYGDSASHYGFGIQSGLLQIHTDGASSDVAFGYGTSASLTETMRIKGNGNVGIGTKTPATKLDVAGTAKMTGFQLGGSATAGQVLTASATGVGTWQALPSIPPSGSAGGDLAGTYPNPVVGAGKIDNTRLASDAASLARVSGGIMSAASGGIGILTLANTPFRVDSYSLTVDQQQNTEAGAVGGAYMWQSFTAGMTGPMQAVEITGSPTNWNAGWSATVYIRAGEGPNGTVLASQGVSGGATVSPVVSTVVFDSPAAVTSGSTYTIHIAPHVGWMWSHAAGNPYPGGRANDNPDNDYWFRTYVFGGSTFPAFQVQSPSGNVGVGTASPSARLDVAGTAKMTGFQLGTAATAGQVLTADATGAGTWQAPASVPPSGAAGGDLTGTYPNPTVGTGKIDSTRILDGTVALADLAANSVDSSKIVDASIALADMAAGSVDSAKLVDGSIASADLASDAASLAKVSGGAAAVSSGNVGIGTTTPSSKLDVAGTAKMTGFRLGASATAGQVLTASATGVGTWQSLPALPPSGSAGGDLAGTYPNPTVGVEKIGNTKLASDAASLAKVSGGTMTAASGKVGIGTIGPGYPLSFADAVGDKISLWGQSGAHYGFGVQSGLLQIYSGGSSTDIAFGYGDSANFTETARMKGTGNVGIGTPTPLAKLHVAGTVKIEAASLLTAPLEVVTRGWTLDQQQAIANYQSKADGLRWQSFTAGVSGSLAGVDLLWGATDGVSNWTATLSIYEGEGVAGTLLSTQQVTGDGAIRVRRFALQSQATLTAGNKYTIATDPDRQCTWESDTGNSYAGGTSGWLPNLDFWFRTYMDAGTSFLALQVEPGSGNVGIGVASGSVSHRLQLPNTADAGGQGQANAWITYSSRRWKENVTPISNALDKVSQLQGVYYDWKGEQGGKHDIGFIAEDAGKVVPELVSWDADGKNASGMDYARVNALLVEAIKEQQKEIDDLRQLVAEMAKEQEGSK